MYIVSFTDNCLLAWMLLYETIPDLAQYEEKQKIPFSDLDAVIACRHGSEDGALVQR
jgi:hypothetical protein